MKTSLKLRIIPVMVVMAVFLSAAAHAQNSVALTVSDSRDGVETLRWGFLPEATAGLDRALGEEEYPPTPPEFLFEARWSDPGGNSRLGQGSKADFRALGGGPDTFLLRVQTAVENYPVTISWPKLGSGIPSAWIRFTSSTGENVSVDMKADTSLIVHNGEAVSKIMMIVAPAGDGGAMPGAEKRGK